MRKVFFVVAVIGVLTLASCGDDEKEVIVEVPVDNPTYAVLGQWYAEVTMDGERVDILGENGEMGPYDHVVISLNFFEETTSSTLFYLFDKELMDYGLYLMGGDPYTIDQEGNIAFPNNTEFMSQVRKFKYEKGEIQVEQTLLDHDVTLRFRRVTGVQLSYLAQWQQIISSQHGFADNDDEQNTDVDDDPANKPAEAAKQFLDFEEEDAGTINLFDYLDNNE